MGGTHRLVAGLALQTVASGRVRCAERQWVASGTILGCVVSSCAFDRLIIDEKVKITVLAVTLAEGGS